jgi:hypothetical protein
MIDEVFSRLIGQLDSLAAKKRNELILCYPTFLLQVGTLNGIFTDYLPKLGVALESIAAASHRIFNEGLSGFNKTWA